GTGVADSAVAVGDRLVAVIVDPDGHDPDLRGPRPGFLRGLMRRDGRGRGPGPLGLRPRRDVPGDGRPRGDQEDGGDELRPAGGSGGTDHGRPAPRRNDRSPGVASSSGGGVGAACAGGSPTPGPGRTPAGYPESGTLAVPARGSDGETTNSLFR